MNELKCEKGTREWFREMGSKEIDEWTDFDLRVACQNFDILEAGCFGCPHYDGNWDWRQTCHLEQEMRRNE